MKRWDKRCALPARGDIAAAEIGDYRDAGTPASRGAAEL
jgi:hypothetical protein